MAVVQATLRVCFVTSGFKMYIYVLQDKIFKDEEYSWSCRYAVEPLPQLLNEKHPATSQTHIVVDTGSSNHLTN